MSFHWLKLSGHWELIVLLHILNKVYYLDSLQTIGVPRDYNYSLQEIDALPCNRKCTAKPQKCTAKTLPCQVTRQRSHGNNRDGKRTFAVRTDENARQRLCRAPCFPSRHRKAVDAVTGGTAQPVRILCRAPPHGKGSVLCHAPPHGKGSVLCRATSHSKCQHPAF
jgi:hypothetical protein